MSDQAQTTETPATPVPAEAKSTKSIVPAKYAGRYKAGGSDALAAFINDNCKGKDGFEYPAFFELCKKNGIDAAKVDHYAGQVSSNRHGSQGRARMTLRNMLATIARKNGKLQNLKGEEVAINLPKPVLSGAAANAAAIAGTADPAKPADPSAASAGSTASKF
jgi:hypothetical protein